MHVQGAVREQGWTPAVGIALIKTSLASGFHLTGGDIYILIHRRRRNVFPTLMAMMDGH